jgi:hypothetical protein
MIDVVVWGDLMHALSNGSSSSVVVPRWKLRRMQYNDDGEFCNLSC